MAATDSVDWPTDQPLLISGGPSSLRVAVTVRAVSDPARAMPRAVLTELAGAGGREALVRSIGMTRGQLRLRLDSATPPGRYEGGIELNGVARPVVIDVVATADIAIRPLPVLIDRGGGKAQTIAFAAENRGNVTLMIDVTGDYSLGEEIAIFPERAVREREDALERLADLFARTIGTRAQRAMREVGAVTLSMPGGAVPIAPGEAATITIAVTMPDGLSPGRRYRAFVPIYTADLELVVVTATKPLPKEQPRERNRGTAT